LLAIAATEYALLGTLAALTGIGIALVGSWVLATFQFNLDFYVPWGSIAAIFVLVVLLIISIGLLNNRDVLRKRPLEVLRAEG
jgi:putative ABC transport system permease protein